MQLDPKLAAQYYDIYRDVFSYPPRVGKQGMTSVMEIMQQQMGRPKTDFAMDKFVDESLFDEMEREGFFKKLPQ